MVGGVHELAGSKRTVDAAEERVVAERDERGERRERREQRRAAAAEQHVETPVPAARRRKTNEVNEGPGRARSLESGARTAATAAEEVLGVGGLGAWETGQG